MESILAEFEAYLFQEKKMARNSLQAYRRDVRGFAGFLKEKNIRSKALDLVLLLASMVLLYFGSK